MKIAEEVTFGAGLLNRLAEIRGNQGAIEDRIKKGRILPLWRGKPLLRPDLDGRQSLAFLSADHAVLQDRLDRCVYLGDTETSPVFAVDISDLTPEGELLDADEFLDLSLQHLTGTPEDHSFGELRGVMAQLTQLEAEIAATARGILEWHRIHRFCANCGEMSDVIMSGWQRRCNSCGRMHFPRTDPVVIMLITHGNSALIGRNENWPPRMYSLLAGFMEPGETIEAATRREVFEETGVRVDRVDYLASQPWPYPASLMIGTRGLATTTDITLDPIELEGALWVSREDMLEVFAGRHPDIAAARKGSIAHFLLTNWLADRLD